MALPFNVTGDVIEASQTASVRAMAAVPAPSTHHELSEPSSLTKTVVPGIVVSPYAKRGYVDHQTLSFDAYDKFIEDDFLGGQRLNPATDGRPDPARPSARTSAFWANWSRTSTSTSHFDHRWCWRSILRPR